MRYRRLGQWGVKVSEVALGTWLTHGGSVDERAAVACTRRAYELGVNLFDTANAYPASSKGDAERVLGKALSAFPRDTYLMASKVYSSMGDSPLQRGLSRQHIMAQIEGSLRRLGTDHIDLYQCHRYDLEVPLEETAGAMNDLVRQGKIVYWGVSEWSADQIEHVVALCRGQGWALPVSNQPRYSILWRENEARVLPTCQRLGLGVLAFSPLDHGVLSGKYEPGAALPAQSRAARTEDTWRFDPFLTDDVLEAVQEFRSLAEGAGHTAAQVALAWCLRTSAVSSVVVGAANLGQLEQNVAVSELGVERDIIDKADRILASARVT